MRYVTFDENDNLTGCFLQDVLPEHADNHLEVTEEQAADWPNLMVKESEMEVVGEGGPVTVTTRTLVARPVEPSPVVVPTAVTMRQARLALHDTPAAAESGFATMLLQVDATIASMPGADGDKARIEWEFSSEVRRQQPMVLQLAPILGLTEQQLDNLFIAAAGL